jgi:hypothetical protein
VTGHEMGSQLKIEVTSRSQTSSTDDAISGELSASWSGFGVSVEGSASFSKEL